VISSRLDFWWSYTHRADIHLSRDSFCFPTALSSIEQSVYSSNSNVGKRCKSRASKSSGLKLLDVCQMLKNEYRHSLKSSTQEGKGKKRHTTAPSSSSSSGNGARKAIKIRCMHGCLIFSCEIQKIQRIRCTFYYAEMYLAE